MDQIKVQIPNQNQPIQDYLSGCTVINKQSAFLGTTILLWGSCFGQAPENTIIGKLRRHRSTGQFIETYLSKSKD